MDDVQLEGRIAEVVQNYVKPLLDKAVRPQQQGDVLKIKEVKERLRCSQSMAYKLFAEGELAGYRVGISIYIYAESVEDYKQRNSNQPKERPFPPEAPVPQTRKRQAAGSASAHKPYRHLR
jgi:excisionase family DNA binding protein